MSALERMGIDDVRGVFEVLEECRESWADPASWRQRFLAGAIRLTAAESGFMAECALAHDLTALRARVVAAVGCRDDEARFWCIAILDQVVDDGALRRLRHGEAAASAFHAGPVADRIHPDRPSPDQDHSAVSLRIAEHQPLAMQTIAVGRDRSGPTFDQRDLQILCLLQGEIAALAGTRLATEGQRSVEGLPSRCLPTLQRLLSGQSEKEIAAASHRSRNTIHEHVKTIYRHFDVSSRGELLAYFIHRTPLPRMASPERVSFQRVRARPVLTC